METESFSRAELKDESYNHRTYDVTNVVMKVSELNINEQFKTSTIHVHEYESL